MNTRDLNIQNYSAWRFLVVEDKEYIRLMVANLLEKLNARGVFTASSGADALKLLRRERDRIDCIISDWNMSPITGLELLQAVRCGAIPDLSPATCFILLTGHAQASVVKAAVNLDVNGYLVKPVSRAKLAETISKAITRPIVPGTPETYRSVTELHVPADLAESSTRAAPWVLGAIKSPRRKQFVEQMAELRREVLASAMDTGAAAGMRNVRREDLRNIGEGMIMAEDVYDQEGRLLMANGTVLSARVLTRLGQLVASSGQAVRLRVGDSLLFKEGS